MDAIFRSTQQALHVAYLVMSEPVREKNGLRLTLIRIIESIGNYQPRLEPSGITIQNDRAVYWLQQGAQPSEQVKKLLLLSGAWSEFSGEAAPAAAAAPSSPAKATPAASIKATPAASVSDEGAEEEAPAVETADAEASVVDEGSESATEESATGEAATEEQS